MERPFVMERYGRLKDMDRSFDIAYWQRLGPEAIFEAAWQMVVDVHKMRGGDPDELRLRKDVECFTRAPARAAADLEVALAAKKPGQALGQAIRLLCLALPDGQDPPTEPP